jgi:UDP-N-acetylglucosamine 2-epimerase (non-hydrolysing)
MQNSWGESSIQFELNLKQGKYFLVTTHRQENVDSPERLRNIILACSRLKLDYQMPVIFSCHPRTAKRIQDCGIGLEGVTIHEPFAFSDFVTLEKHALCVLTDSGTVQEECCILRSRCVTIRDTTERPETIECGSNILSGVMPVSILDCVKTVLSQGTDWTLPEGYFSRNVSDKVVRIVTGF